MAVPTLESLEQLFKLCRDNDVSKITLDNVAVEFSFASQRISQSPQSVPLIEPEPTPEELMFGHSGFEVGERE